MFGPNDKPSFHQHEQRFFDLLESISIKFHRLFNISDDFDVLILPGCGSFVNEMFAWSLNDKGFVPDTQRDATFGRRLSQQLQVHSKLDTSFASNWQCGVQYETSISRKNSNSPTLHLQFLDCISGFPYYDVPETVDVWTTVIGKQFACYPGLGIIVFRKKLKYQFLPDTDETYSVLNINRARGRLKEWKPPHTPAFSLMMEFENTLLNWDTEAFRAKIDDRRNLLIDAVGVDAIIGEGPVITFKELVVSPYVIKKYNLFTRPHCQCFLWTGKTVQYKNLARDLR